MNESLASTRSSVSGLGKASSRRSLTGVLLALVMLPVLVVTMGCYEFLLPVPIGNPERSTIDRKLSGAWVSSFAEGSVFFLEPYDRRTWFGTLIGLDEPEEAEASNVPEKYEGSDVREGLRWLANTLESSYFKPAEGAMLFKVWLSLIKHKEFLIWEMFYPGRHLVAKSEKDFTNIYWVFKLERQSSDEFKLIGINNEFKGLGESKTRYEAERIIRRHFNDPELFSDDEESNLHFLRLGEESYEVVFQFVDDLGIGLGFD